MTTVELIALVALVAFSVYRQSRLAPVTGHGRFKLPLIYAMVGICLGVSIVHTPLSLGLFAIGLVASLIVGLLRGRMTRVWREADGRIYSRGTVASVAMFFGLIAFKFALGTVAYLTHARYERGIGTILVMIGVMLAVQAELVWRRAQALAGGRDIPGRSGESTYATASH